VKKVVIVYGLDVDFAGVANSLKQSSWLTAKKRLYPIRTIRSLAE
jgi:hypothetical protein